jgi:hypothetical protein
MLDLPALAIPAAEDRTQAAAIGGANTLSATGAQAGGGRFVFISIGMVVSRATLTRDRETNTVTIGKIHFLYVPTMRTITLDDIRSANAQTLPIRIISSS